MMFHVEAIGHTIFLLRKLECFKHVLWRIQVSRWYVLRTTQNGDFVLLPLCVAPCWRTGALAPCRRSGARLAQWRPSVLSLPLVFSLCTCALLLNIHLDSCDRTRAISFKQVTSTAPSSTFWLFFMRVPAPPLSLRSDTPCRVSVPLARETVAERTHEGLLRAVHMDM